MNIKIEEAEEAWTSPDKTKVLWKVTTATCIVYKTWSKTIGKKGWSGEVEVYEKDGQEFIKQPYSGARGGAKEFKADPAKMKQDFALQVATNQSIQRQVALKAVVDLIVHDKADYTEMDVVFNKLMGLLNPKLGGEHENDQSADI